MTRPPRIQYPDAIYHVYFRGNNGQDIFYDDEDREYFIDRLRQTVNRYGWRMFAFCEMTNHVHQHQQTPEPNLSAGMQFLLSAFANQVNRRHGLRGHLLQGRFRSEVIEDESYSWNVSRYVHLNPARTAVPMVEKLADWRWSSYPGYANPEKRWDFVDYEAVYRAWAGEFGPNAQNAYKSFVQQGIETPPANPFDHAVDGWILGSESFVTWLKERVGMQQSPIDVPQMRRFITVELEELLSRVSKHFRIPAEHLTRRGARHISRSVFAWLSRKYTRATRKQLAQLLNLKHPDGVSPLIRKVEQLRQHDPTLASHLAILQAGFQQILA